MRRSLLMAALLATTALTPTPAVALPVIGFVLGSIGATGAALSLGIAAGVSAGTIFGATFLGGILVKSVVAVGLSFLSQFLAPKPQIQAPSERMVNFAQPLTYMEMSYGRTRKGGPVGFTGFVNDRRYYMPIVAAHSIEGFVEHWLDERVVTLNSEADQSLSNIATAPIAGFGRINTFDGSAGQVVDPGLDAAFPEMTAAHDFESLAGAVLWAKRPPGSLFSDVYPTGTRWIYAPVIDGNDQIYDPRGGGSTSYSNNAALVLADWLVNVLGQSVDWTEVEVEADVCDEIVTNAEGTTQARWTINGTISDGEDFEEQRAQVAAACDAFLYEKEDGKVGFNVGRWIAPTITLTAADCLELDFTTGRWGADRVTDVVVTYTEPANAWRETPAGRWIEDATAKTVSLEPSIYMVGNHNQASRLAKRIAKVKNADAQLKVTLGLIGYELIGHRFFRLVHAEMGIDSYFEVGKLTKEGMALFTLEAVSVEAADFDFVAATEEPTRPVYDSVANTDEIPDVAGLTVVSIGNGSIKIDWTAEDAAYPQQIHIVLTGGSEWQVYTVPAGVRPFIINGLLDGATYDIQGRNRTVGRREGEWKPDTPVTVTIIDNPTAPPVLTDFTGVLNGSTVDLSITSPNDVNYHATNVYEAVNSTSFGDAASIGTVYNLPNSTVIFTSDTLSSDDHSFWAEPINESGVAGTKSGPVTITVP